MNHQENTSIIIPSETDIITNDDTRVEQLRAELARLEGDQDSYVPARVNPREALIERISSPERLQESFELTDKQVVNVASALTGAGAFMGRKYLTGVVGAPIAGGLGGAIGGWLSKKITGK